MGRLPDGILFLDVVGDDEAGDGALALGDAHAAVDEVAGLRRRHAGVHVAAGDVLEEVLQVDFLLVVAADRRARLLADDGEDRLVVEAGIVKPVQEMDRAGTGGGQADADLAGPFGVGAGHEGRFLLVPGLDEFDRVLPVAAEGRDDAADAVAGEAVDALDAPFLEAGENEIGDLL